MDWISWVHHPFLDRDPEEASFQCMTQHTRNIRPSEPEKDSERFGRPGVGVVILKFLPSTAHSVSTVGPFSLSFPMHKPPTWICTAYLTAHPACTIVDTRVTDGKHPRNIPVPPGQGKSKRPRARHPFFFFLFYFSLDRPLKDSPGHPRWCDYQLRLRGNGRERSKKKKKKPVARLPVSACACGKADCCYGVEGLVVCIPRR
ncbi:hypothetical protein QBC44DRAFT_6565 [Cladorrhinum sp. PSN332]|nr:hypothetical protein QBC44DRAFT_6565 [Cladorrhinum sp. PSN332]